MRRPTYLLNLSEFVLLCVILVLFSLWFFRSKNLFYVVPLISRKHKTLLCQVGQIMTILATSLLFSLYFFISSCSSMSYHVIRVLVYVCVPATYMWSLDPKNFNHWWDFPSLQKKKRKKNWFNCKSCSLEIVLSNMDP